MVSKRTSFTLGICALGLLLLTPRPCASQEDRKDSPLQGGAWALQFKIEDDFQLSTFKGSVLSIKRHYSPNSALRAGVSFSLSTVDLEDDFISPDTTFSTVRDIDSYDFGIELQYLRYSNPDARVSMFWGVGPSLNVSRNESGLSNGNTSTSVNKRWRAGITASVGAEWFPVGTVGIHAEYGVAFEYSSTVDEAENNDSLTRKRDGDAWLIRGRSVLFGLSIYF